jgi:rRNA-processing protein FCF1
MASGGSEGSGEGTDAVRAVGESLPRISLVFSLDQDAIVQWFVLGGDNPVPMPHKEMFMLSQFDEKGTVTLPDGQTLEGERIFVNTMHCRCVFAKYTPPSQGKRVSVMVKIRPGWRHLYHYIVSQNKGAGGRFFSVDFVCRQVPTAKYAGVLLGALDPTGRLGAGEKGEASAVIQMGGGKKCYSLKEDVYPKDGYRRERAVIVDTENHWGEDLSVAFPIDRCTNFTPNDSTMLSVIDALHFFKANLSARKGAARTRGETSVHPLPVRSIVMKYKHELLRRAALSHEGAGSKKRKLHSTAAPVDGTVSMDCRDPVLRKKFHVVVDTNVWIKAAKTSFSFFDVLEAYFETKVVVVIPFVVYLELDHLKKGNRADLAVGDVSRKCINYINKRINSGKNGFVIQTVEEDDLCTESSKEKKHGTKNDMRVVFCCKHRLGKGMKVILLSGDVNVLNLGMSMSGGETFYDRDKSVKGTSPGIECLFFEPLAALLQDPRYARLEPALWGKILKARAAHRTR